MRKSKKDPQRITKLKPFLNKYNWKKINSPSETDDSKKIEKITEQLLFMFYMLKKKTYILLMLQNISQIVKIKLSL